MRSLMVWRLSGRNISRSFRFVIMRVLDGGVGCWRAGTAEISRLRGVREREDAREDSGVDWVVMVLVVKVLCYSVVREVVLVRLVCWFIGGLFVVICFSVV